MVPCINTHCPSSKHGCQRYSCTLELRNRLERRRSERNQLEASVDAERNTTMRTLRKLREDCNKPDKAFLSQAKQAYENQASKTISRPKCFCAECGVEHKNREIASLRRNYQVLQILQQAVVDVQMQKKRRRERHKATTPSPRADAPPAWCEHACHAAVKPSVDVRAVGIIGILPVKDLLDREIIVERLAISGRASR